MRTNNIDIDDAILDAAMRAGPFKTKKDAVEAGLKLLSRQADYREVLKWEGKPRWEGHDGGYCGVRAQGITVRRAIDVLVAGFCIERGDLLLHRERDFDAFEDHRGLRAWAH
jgi:Arc/MetJ family transcription regulator